MFCALILDIQYLLSRELKNGKLVNSILKYLSILGWVWGGCGGANLGTINARRLCQNFLWKWPKFPSVEMILKLHFDITKVQLFMHHNCFEWAPCIETFGFFSKCEEFHKECALDFVDRNSIKECALDFVDCSASKQGCCLTAPPFLLHALEGKFSFYFGISRKFNSTDWIPNGNFSLRVFSREMWPITWLITFWKLLTELIKWPLFGMIFLQ